MDAPTIPPEVKLAQLEEALAWMEQNYVSLDAAPDGRWYCQVWHVANELELEADGSSFLDAYEKLRKIAGDSPYGG